MRRTAPKKINYRFIALIFVPIIFLLFFFLKFDFGIVNKKVISPLVLGDSSEAKIAEKLSDLNIKYLEIKQESQKLIVVGENDFSIIFDRNKDINLQLTSLQLIIEKNKMEGRQAKKIDLSFENPIVVF